MNSFKRVIWIVLDGVGAGALPDAGKYGDLGSDTLGNLSREIQKNQKRILTIPSLQSLGIGNITSIAGIDPVHSSKLRGAFGRAAELSLGKDTSSGHWEMAGLVVEKAFATFPDGFPKEVVDRWCKENGLPGVLGNKSASGTEIIQELGEEHVRTGKPILYTSADSVWQVAAHETAFGLEKLYSICKSARKICDQMQIGRVIARPFIGDPKAGKPYQRTYNRKDYSYLPFRKTVLDYLGQKNIPVLGIGKISNIFAGQGVPENIDTKGNRDGIEVILKEMRSGRKGLLYCNLIDFDMLFGHRRDVAGFGSALENFDQGLAAIQKEMTGDDLLILTSDHGNDPTFKGTDHTREYIPLLCYSPRQDANGLKNIGIRASFGDAGATVYHALTGQELNPSQFQLTGKSFLREMGLST